LLSCSPFFSPLCFQRLLLYCDTKAPDYDSPTRTLSSFHSTFLCHATYGLFHQNELNDGTAERGGVFLNFIKVLSVRRHAVFGGPQEHPGIFGLLILISEKGCYRAISSYVFGMLLLLLMMMVLSF
jgi:hypothetical protein